MLRRVNFQPSARCRNRPGFAAAALVNPLTGRFSGVPNPRTLTSSICGTFRGGVDSGVEAGGDDVTQRITARHEVSHYPRSDCILAKRGRTVELSEPWYTSIPEIEYEHVTSGMMVRVNRCVSQARSNSCVKYPRKNWLGICFLAVAFKEVGSNSCDT